MSDGFLRRWSQRKLEAKEGRDLEAQPLPPAKGTGVEGGSEASHATQPDPTGKLPLPATAPEPVPPPTLEEAEALTMQSDFTRFAAPNVPPEVKNAAMKKLFTDPRYNAMDGLDVYTGDYSQPDPMPVSMLRQLASAKFLGLFDEKQKQEISRGTRDVADDSAEEIVAQSLSSSQAVPEPVSAPPQHADPDLRLQQDHAASGKGTGSGAR